jgi:hypothetical protein
MKDKCTLRPTVKCNVCIDSILHCFIEGFGSMVEGLEGSWETKVPVIVTSIISPPIDTSMLPPILRPYIIYITISVYI